MSGIGLFGGAIAICVGTVITSTILHIFGKGEMAEHLDSIAQLAMLTITVGGIYLVLNMIVNIFGINVPVGLDIVDKLFTFSLPKF